MMNWNKLLKGAVVAHLKLLLQHLLEETMNSHKVSEG
jgi:hypothetical protein